jgi:murein L,D-transpeptidase YafK
MIKKTLIIALAILLCSFSTNSFKKNQLRYKRVREAYRLKEANLNSMLLQNGISRDKLMIYLRAFKKEKQIELWGKNREDNSYKLIKTYKICRLSGVTGPKRRQGDLQIPEGFYHISAFNPASSYHLSMAINYPNRSDRILGVKNNLGNNICIHGDCVTIGCLPITDDKIEELYIFCIEAKNNGQSRIPVTIFPCKLTDPEYNRISEKYKNSSDKVGLWTDLKKGYDIFNSTKKLPNIGFLKSGRHRVTK